MVNLTISEIVFNIKRLACISALAVLEEIQIILFLIELVFVFSQLRFYIRFGICLAVKLLVHFFKLAISVFGSNFLVFIARHLDANQLWFVADCVDDLVNNSNAAPQSAFDARRSGEFFNVVVGYVCALVCRQDIVNNLFELVSIALDDLHKVIFRATHRLYDGQLAIRRVRSNAVKQLVR